MSTEFIIVLFMGFGFGILMALPSLVPAFRRIFQRAPFLRFVVGMLSTVLSFYLLTGFIAYQYPNPSQCESFQYQVGGTWHESVTCQQAMSIEGIHKELWQRTLFPPNIRQAICLSNNIELCTDIQRMGIFQGESSANSWGTYIAIFLGSILAFFSASEGIAFFARRRTGKEKEKEKLG